MASALVNRPTASLAAPRYLRVHRAGWLYEEKVDGWRILAYKDGARVRLVSRNGRDHTRRFADLAAAIAKLSARSLVLDGEVAIYDQQLRSRFDWLREPDQAPSPRRRCSCPSTSCTATAAT
jgi:ATP-dependent DNA ligase